MKFIYKTLAFLGAFHVVFMILGALNFMDYRLCIKEVGHCNEVNHE